MVLQEKGIDFWVSSKGVTRKKIKDKQLSGGDGKGQPVTLSLFGFPFHFLVVLTF